MNCVKEIGWTNCQVFFAIFFCYDYGFVGFFLKFIHQTVQCTSPNDLCVKFEKNWANSSERSVGQKSQKEWTEVQVYLHTTALWGLIIHSFLQLQFFSLYHSAKH